MDFKAIQVLVYSKRLYRTRRNQIFCIAFIIASCLMTVFIVFAQLTLNTELVGFKEINEILEGHLIKSIREEKGTGCHIPKLDLFSEEIIDFKEGFRNTSKIACAGTDWVNCYKTECSVVKEILKNMTDLVCIYTDIVYVNDNSYNLGKPVTVLGDRKYILNKSDHVKISCSGRDINSLGILASSWHGFKAGFRPIPLPPTPPEQKDGFNVLVLAFNSTSHNGFIRRMPKSHRYLNEQLKAVILNSYSIVGDGTSAALFPILTGKAETEQTDARKKLGNKRYLDHTAFIFHQLKKHGYRTAYFEDTPSIGTFQYRFNGFSQQPADHYLRAFFTEESETRKRWWGGSTPTHCIGAIPFYQLLMDLTRDFVNLEGKKFCFTLISDISHNDYQSISNADEALVQLLTTFRERQILEDTLVVVMGDHGTRFGAARYSYQGRLEERLPLMAVLLPERLKRNRPEALKALENNKDVLTTHFDLHATLMDVLDLKQYRNRFVVPGSDLPRSMSLLEEIPKTRTCGEAGVVPHWCICTKWYNVSATDIKYSQVADVLTEFINSIIRQKRAQCVSRKLVSIEWVMRLIPNGDMVKYTGNVQLDGYLGDPAKTFLKADNEYYQAKIIMSPGKAIFEGTMVYHGKSDYYYINLRDISRVNAYGNEPACISQTHPHLNKFCYCKDRLTKRLTKRNLLNSVYR